MTKQSDTPRVPDLMEAVFDTCYLLFDLIAGILFFAFSHGSPLFLLYGILTWTLCFGDAFHLVPRVLRAVKGSNETIGHRLTDFLHHHDGILYSFAVYLETDIL